MDIIRDRVATRSFATDDFPGLGLKAYCVRFRGADGAPVNQYAPFYLWASAAGMNEFLWGKGFRGLVDSFGRPPVEHWTGVEFRRGPAIDEPPRAAGRLRELIAPDADPAEHVHRALDGLAAHAEEAGVHSCALVVDPLRWELVRFTLWNLDPADVPATPEEIRYHVLHLSKPQLAELA